MAQPHPSSFVRRFHPGLRHHWSAHLRRTTSWVAAGSAALAVALIGLAAHETPPRTSGATTSPTVPSTGSGSTTPPTGPGTTTGAARPATRVTRSVTAGVTRSSGSGPVVSPGAGRAHVSSGLS